jgi:serine/threonine protein kinase
MQTGQLSDFELGDALGVGTVGTIYIATDRKTKEWVAVKKLHPGVSQDPLIRSRFEREMTILERLRHPNIIAYYCGGVDNGQLYYVMELVRGGTVKELLAGGRALPWTVVVEVSRQICSALQFAHNHGVIHRDLKPGNLFLKRTGEVKLGDFGIARDVTAADLTDTGLTVGTHAYMAPEQITGDNTISGKADLYALGCCMFEMLTGRKVFDGENFAQLFEQHLRKDPPHVKDSVPDCPVELDAIVYQLLAKSPEDRPFNARHVQAVMLKLDEQVVAGAGRTAETGDVGADGVTDLGRQLLQEQIAGRIGGTPRAEVSWLKLAFVGVAVAAVIAVAVMLG